MELHEGIIIQYIQGCDLVKEVDPVRFPGNSASTTPSTLTKVYQ